MKVKILERRGQAALVEWRDVTGPHRSILPAERATGDVESAVLEEGIPYGAPWESLVSITATPALVARLLRESGIWDEASLAKNIPSVRAVFQRAFATDLKNLLDAVRAARESGE